MRMDGEERRSYHKRDRLRQIQAFCEAARRKSITEAADFLGITQPAVSLQVRELENELQAVLFDRAGPRIALTPAGERLYELAEPLVAGMDRLYAGFVEQIEEVGTGRVHLAASHAGIYSVHCGETAARQFGLDARSAIEVGGWGVVKRHVEAGLGVAVVPGICISETDRLSVIPLHEYFPSRSYGVFRRRDKLMAPAARRLLRLMEPAGDATQGTVSDRQGMNGAAVRMPGSASVPPA